MPDTVAVQPELIQWAVERSRLPAAELAERFPKLDSWISGEKQPTMRQLEDFAKRRMKDERRKQPTARVEPV